MDRLHEHISHTQRLQTAHGDREQTPILRIGSKGVVAGIPRPAGAVHVAQYRLHSAIPQPLPPETPLGYRWRIVSAEHRDTHAQRRLAVLERISLYGGLPPDPPDPPAAAGLSPRRRSMGQSEPSNTRSLLPFPPFRVA